MRLARVMHAAMVAGVAIIVIAFGVLRSAIVAPDVGDIGLVLRVVGLAQLVVLGATIPIVRRTIASLRPDEDAEQWWATYLPRAIVIWALAEGTALLGGVFWYLTADPLFLVLSAAALAVLVTQRPGVLTG